MTLLFCPEGGGRGEEGKGAVKGGDIQGKISKAARSGPMGETHSESRAVHVGLGHFVITHG